MTSLKSPDEVRAAVLRANWATRLILRAKKRGDVLSDMDKQMTINFIKAGLDVLPELTRH